MWEQRRAEPGVVAELLAGGDWHVGVECDTDAGAHTIAAAVRAADGRIAVRAWHVGSYAAVDALLGDWRAARLIGRLLVTPPYESRLPSQRGRLELVGRREAPAATRALAELLSGSLVHDGDATLTSHMLRGRAINTEHGPMLSTVRSAGTIHAARAAMFATWSALSTPVQARRSRARYRPATGDGSGPTGEARPA